MTLQEICEKVGCTQKDIVDAMLKESKDNQAIHYQAKREAEDKIKAIETQFKALKKENDQMEALVANWRLSKLMKEMDNERKEFEKSKRLITTVETPTGQPEQPKPESKIIKMYPDERP
jgi:hypothetical protein